jgi:hypothetical protein
VVCRFRPDEGLSYDREAQAVLPGTDPQFRRDDGTIDLILRLRYLQSLQVVRRTDDPGVLVPTAFQLQLTRFLSEMIEGANVLEAYHMTPDGRCWRDQPRWRRQLWMAYMAGRNEKYE